MQTVVNIVAGDPTQAITHGTLQLAATKMRQETLANSRLFPGIIDVRTGQFLSNVSYASGYFDGVKLGGVRIDLDAICGTDNRRCTTRSDGIVEYRGDEKFHTLQDAINPKLNKEAGRMYGATGGFQAGEGGWYLPFGVTIPYKPGSWSDRTVEAFGGPHDCWVVKFLVGMTSREIPAVIAHGKKMQDPQ